jgi:hypothetical protein
MHAPLAVQHWAAMLVPSGVAVAAGEVMQTPLETASESPLRANVLSGAIATGGGACVGGRADDGGDDGHDSPLHT